MFLSLLSHAQKTAFAKVARWIIAADDVEDESEQWFMHLSLNEMGLDNWPQRPGSEQEFLAALDLFDNPVSKNIMLIEAVCVALADGEIDPTEKAVLVRITGYLNMREAKIDEFTGYASDYIDLVNRGEDLITRK